MVRIGRRKEKKERRPKDDEGRMTLREHIVELRNRLLISVLAIVVGTIVVAIAVGYGLDWVDKKTHATEHVTSWFRSIGESMKHAAEYLEKSMPKDYDAYPMMYMP